MTGGDDTKTHILNLKSLSWRSGPDLDVPVKYASVVQYGNTFLIVGGFRQKSSGERFRDIRQFDPEANKWIIRSEKLKTPKMDMAAVWVPDDYFHCT